MSRYISLLVIFIVTAFFLVYDFYFSVDFPFQDDGLLMRFVETVTRPNSGFSIFISELFRTENDHKAVVPKLVALADYAIDGRLNFRFYVVLVMVNLVVICYFLYRQFRKFGLPEYYFIPVPLLFFQPLYHEISGWGLCGMQHTFVTMFVIGGIYLAPKKYYLSILCCFLSTFSHGNGILAFGAVMFYFLYFSNFKKAGLTLVFAVLTLGLYLLSYEKGQAATFPKDIGTFFLSFFDFIGSSVSMWASPKLWSAIWGAMITLLMTILIVRIVKGNFTKTKASPKPGYAELLSLFMFIAATGAIIALFRSSSSEIIASRYQLYASLSMVIFYLLLVDYFSVIRAKAVFVTVAALSVFYWGYSFYKYTGIVASKRTTYKADIFNWKNTRNLFTMEIVGDSRFYLDPSYKRGIFFSPKPVAEPAQLDSMFASKNKTNDTSGTYLEIWNVDRPNPHGVQHLRNYFISSKTFPNRKKISGDRFLVLKDQVKGTLYLMSANPKIAARKDILTEGIYYHAGFNTLIRSTDLPDGTYSLAILDVDDSDGKKFNILDKSLEVSNKIFFLKQANP